MELKYIVPIIIYDKKGMYLSIKMKIQSDLIGDNKFNIMNTITFKVDRTFSREYGQEKAYCLCLDLTADATSNEPPI